MSGRAVSWLGGLLVIVAVIGLSIYFAMVGLDEADKLASVLGTLVSLTGIALTVYGTTLSRRDLSSYGARVHNEIHDGAYGGPVIQGRDIGQILPLPPPADEPGAPNTS